MAHDEALALAAAGADTRAVRCPRCKQGLALGGWENVGASPYRPRLAASFQRFECKQCNGSWVPVYDMPEMLRTLARDHIRGGKLDAALALIESRWSRDTEQLDAAQSLKLDCPKCANPMDKLRSRAVKMVLFDRCERCRGLWFDADELPRIVRALGEGLDRLGWRDVPKGSARRVPGDD